VESQLVEATWGLVVATSLLFLAAIIPAIGEIRARSSQKKELASNVIPVLHAERVHLNEVKSELLSLHVPWTADDFASSYSNARGTRSRCKEIYELKNLSLAQRLEMSVLMMHLTILTIHLNFMTDDEGRGEESAISDTERVRSAIIETEAALTSMRRLDHLFAGFRHGTFTEKALNRVSEDIADAETQLKGVLPEELTGSPETDP
jgi:hypothetical protein